MTNTVEQNTSTLSKLDPVAFREFAAELPHIMGMFEEKQEASKKKPLSQKLTFAAIVLGLSSPVLAAGAWAGNAYLDKNYTTTEQANNSHTEIVNTMKSLLHHQSLSDAERKRERYRAIAGIRQLTPEEKIGLDIASDEIRRLNGLLADD